MIAEMGVYCGFTAKQSKLILQSPMLFRREFPQLQSTAIRVGRTHFHASWKGMTNFRPELPTTVDISSLTPEMRSTMLKYQPTFLDRDLWLKIRNYVFELVVRVEPPKTHDLTRALRLLAGYVGSLVHDDHLDVARTPIEVVFDPARVEMYVTGARMELAPAHDRRYYRRYGRVFNPAGAWAKGSPVTARTERMDPYTAAEVDAMLRALKSMRRGKYRELLTVVINVVLACGAGTTELTLLKWEDFRIAPGLGWVVDLPGGSARTRPLPPRTVPLAKPYRAAVVRMARTRTGLIINPSFDDPRYFSSVVGSAASEMHVTPKVSITGLRTTWMVNRAVAGVPFPDLAEAAGIAWGSLVRALEGHVDPTTGAQWFRTLSREST